MNRALVFGIAIFFAVVGIALLGGENNKVLAGHGCHCACSGDCGGCHDDCGGCGGCSSACHCGGRQGLFARLRARRCCRPACCEPACCQPACCAPSCGNGGSAPDAAPPAPAPAPAPAPKA